MLTLKCNTNVPIDYIRSYQISVYKNLPDFLMDCGYNFTTEFNSVFSLLFFVLNFYMFVMFL